MRREWEIDCAWSLEMRGHLIHIHMSQAQGSSSFCVSLLELEKKKKPCRIQITLVWVIWSVQIQSADTMKFVLADGGQEDLHGWWINNYRSANVIWKGFQVLDSKAVHHAETFLCFFSKSCGKIHFFSITVLLWAMGFYINFILSAKAWTILFHVTDFSIWPRLSSLKWEGLSWKEVMEKKKLSVLVSVKCDQYWTLGYWDKKKRKIWNQVGRNDWWIIRRLHFQLLHHNHSMAALYIGYLMFG